MCILSVYEGLIILSTWHNAVGEKQHSIGKNGGGTTIHFSLPSHQAFHWSTGATYII